MKKYNIGVFSQVACTGLIELLCKEGHNVSCWWLIGPTVKKAWGKKHMEEETTGLWRKYKNFKVEPLLDIKEWAEKQDFILVDFNEQMYLIDTLREVTKKVIGASAYGRALETNRSFGKAMVEDLDPHIKNPPSGYQFPNPATAYKWAEKNARNNFVIKGWDTIVPVNLQDALNHLKYPSKKVLGKDAIYLEQMMTGCFEIAFGAWIDIHGNYSLGIITNEHKGAANGDRGRVLTGEVGTAFHICDYYDFPVPVRVILDAVKEPLRKSEHIGFVDINTLFDPASGILYFLEWTMRPGMPTELEIAAAHQKNQDTEGYGDFLAHLVGINDDYRGSVRGLSGLATALFPHGLGYAATINPMSILYNEDPFLTQQKKTHLFEGKYADKETVHLGGQDRGVFLINFGREGIKPLIEQQKKDLPLMSAWGHTHRDDIGEEWVKFFKNNVNPSRGPFKDNIDPNRALESMMRRTFTYPPIRLESEVYEVTTSEELKKKPKKDLEALAFEMLHVEYTVEDQVNWNVLDFLYLLKRENSFIEMYRANGRLIAYSITSKEKGYSYLQTLAVMPQYQKRGFGRRLVDSSIRREKKRTKGKLVYRLHCRPHLVKWYTKAGLKQVRTLWDARATMEYTT